MRTSASLTTLLCGIASAQFASDMFSGMPVVCQNGQAPALTCADPVPELCNCKCNDGMVFNQTRPDPPLLVPEPVSQQLVDKPCLGNIFVPWTQIDLPHTPGTYEPSDMYDKDVEVPEESVFVVADSAQRCQHFEVFVDGEKVGVTNGDGPLDGMNCGNAEKCINENGGSRGYFTIQKGSHRIGLRWIGVTDACKNLSSGKGSYQIYERC
ncbi:hypothetical protein BKA58DRAFT_462055 [Alternaria rosae]|uniref:uncharacterized protein n=1 Tax=Alternaria rosae TaxID=1187941 RepID=UPI001E8D5BE2|nr:uncharacterized protein BKA58DRAFT_462055 [Alternaria rosae]KAH6865990.1 hypothetical protein BKA58DRAFT_462055 [Alternaria rosae]